MAGWSGGVIEREQRILTKFLVHSNTLVISVKYKGAKNIYRANKVAPFERGRPLWKGFS